MKLWKKGKKVVALLTHHTDAVNHTLQSTETALVSYLDGLPDPDQTLNAAVDRAESEADLIRREIQKTLYAGAYLPRLREDIFHLVDQVDRIADTAESCSDFFTIQHPEIPPEYKDAFRELIQMTLGNFEPFRQAMRVYFKPKGKLDEVLEYCEEASKMESLVDRQEEILSTQIFSSNLDLAHKMHLQGCVKKITHLSDCTEDAADLLMRVAIKSVV